MRLDMHNEKIHPYHSDSGTNLSSLLDLKMKLISLQEKLMVTNFVPHLRK
jgi:hypothetical protein